MGRSMSKAVKHFKASTVHELSEAEVRLLVIYVW